MELAFLIGRILYGGFFIVMGMNHFTKFAVMAGYASSKRVPFPSVAVVVTGLMIVFGGLGIVTGVYVQLAVLLIVIFLFFVSIFIATMAFIHNPFESFI